MSRAGALRLRPPAVAGTFYPADPDGLRAAVEDAFRDGVPGPEGAVVPRALVVPHAGYIYSGPVAASAYARLVPARDRIRRVVLLGPSHYVPLDGMAVAGVDALDGPLGPVPVDTEARRVVRSLAQVRVDDAPHAPEHSLEVQIPFLQLVLDRFAVLPVAVGRCRPEAVADLLEALWDGPETVVVVSTDLSHYHPYEVARERDRRTASAVVGGRPEGVADDGACGAHALRGLLELVRRRRLAVEELDLRNSGDTAGGRDRVVGYGAFAVA